MELLELSIQPDHMYGVVSIPRYMPPPFVVVVDILRPRRGEDEVSPKFKYLCKLQEERDISRSGELSSETLFRRGPLLTTLFLEFRGDTVKCCRIKQENG